MSSTINVFDLDTSDVMPPVRHPRYDMHVVKAYEPCNCDECLTYAAACGVIKVHMLPHPQTREMTYVPITNDDDTAMLAMSPEYIAKFFRQNCACDLFIFASYMIENAWRAPRKDLSGGKYLMSDKSKRKSADESTPSKKARTGNAPVDVDASVDVE
jgi:hypothetical protein